MGTAFRRHRGAAELAAGRGAGANDGIVSVAGIVVGVAGATSSRGPIFTAGLADSPEAEMTELTAPYEAKGLSAATARTVAEELTAHGALAAHLDAELHIDPADIPSSVQAAAASALSARPGLHLWRGAPVRYRHPLRRPGQPLVRARHTIRPVPGPIWCGAR
jgi:hypothetical protein